jgi:glutamyl-tRNA synthetase
MATVFAGLGDWSAPAIHTAIEQHAAATGKSIGDIAQPLRVAITGSTVSPPIHDTLAILGKQATLKRIERCLAAVM